MREMVRLGSLRDARDAAGALTSLVATEAAGHPLDDRESGVVLSNLYECRRTGDTAVVFGLIK